METNNKKISAQVNDPPSAYGISLSSHIAMEESQYSYWAALSPEQRLMEHYQLLQRFFPEADANKAFPAVIVFRDLANP